MKAAKLSIYSIKEWKMHAAIYFHSYLLRRELLSHLIKGVIVSDLYLRHNHIRSNHQNT